MKTNSKIVMLFAGVAMSVTTAGAYAQSAPGNQQAPNMQDCQPTAERPCGEGMQGMGRHGRDDGGRQGKWGGRMASNEDGRRGHDGHGPRGMGPGKRGQGAQIMFQRADKDNSGTVTLEEFAAASPFTFSDADANSDGNITAEELADHMERQMLLRRAKMMIERFDADGDGQVSTAEIEKRRQEAFARMDIDGSGAIEQDEMQLRRGGDRDHRGERGERGERGQFHRHNGGGYGRN